ncbi:glycosyltransferase [Ulvibacter sp. MAR_2010_11]|uniref:glycosyltransferase family 2 protein n=1 Tax=Ulvibacter sp. MAR_2010_11 TaxID=1250229 RepID=UPI0012FD529C|nr:glycosyltransferase [Ulvibacter sp. MAR_2010_11]
MLSILIPTYNHNVYQLVETLQKELGQKAIDCEIIVMDDGSTIPLPHNDKIIAFPNVSFKKLPKNIGRSAIRGQLASAAKFENLLFLDADVLPVSETFLANYLAAIVKNDFDVIFGGVAYQNDAPSEKERLRWKYGKEREVQTVSEREKHPYFIITQNLLIKKECFESVNKALENFYGDDLVISQALKRKKSKVLHIDNPVYHLGLESSENYLKKALSAISSIVSLEKSGLLDADFTKLQQSYVLLKNWKMTTLFSKLISPFKKKMERNFVSANPNLLWFDLYRLNYYIELKSESHA